MIEIFKFQGKYKHKGAKSEISWEEDNKQCQDI